MKKSCLFVMASVACLVCACAEEKAEVRVENEPCVDRCEDNVMKYCNGSKSDCSFGCNAEGNGCATQASSCTPGCKNGIFTKCKGGAAEIVNCPTGQCNAAGTACGEQQSDVCKPSCSNNVATVCNGGVASTQQCTYGCRGSACATSPKCTPSCKDGVATLCDGDVPTTKECPNGCNATNDGCLIGGGGECEQATKCNGNVLTVCDVSAGFKREFSYNCADYRQECTTVNGIDDCRDTCTTPGETKKQCNQGSFSGSYTLDYVCTQGADGRNYWLRNDASEKPCNSGEACNATFTACALSESCNPASYQASCTDNIAKTCNTFETVQYANCTLQGKTCVKTTSTTAECIDNDMSCTSIGAKKTKCGISESTKQPVSVVYTCTLDNAGNMYYLNPKNEACGNYGCEESTGKCVTIDNEEGQKCDPNTYYQHCNSTRAIYCAKTTNQVAALECNDPTDPGYECLTVHNSKYDVYVDCFSAEKDSCTNEGSVRQSQGDTGVFTHECSRASDGNLYWAEINFVEN